MAPQTYEWTNDMREISGAGPAHGYELDCRKMVAAGLTWLDEHPGEFERLRAVADLRLHSPEIEPLTKAMNAAIGNEATGAMMTACVTHVLRARLYGWPKFVEAMREALLLEQHDAAEVV